jgi:hypothetical protein
MILGDKPLISEVVLSQCSPARTKGVHSLAKARQLVFYDDFDFILGVLMLIFFSFGFSVWFFVVVLLLL